MKMPYLPYILLDFCAYHNIYLGKEFEWNFFKKKERKEILRSPRVDSWWNCAAHKKSTWKTIAMKMNKIRQRVTVIWNGKTPPLELCLHCLRDEKVNYIKAYIYLVYQLLQITGICQNKFRLCTHTHRALLFTSLPFSRSVIKKLLHRFSAQSFIAFVNMLWHPFWNVYSLHMFHLCCIKLFSSILFAFNQAQHQAQIRNYFSWLTNNPLHSMRIYAVLNWNMKSFKSVKWTCFINQRKLKK